MARFVLDSILRTEDSILYHVHTSSYCTEYTE